MSIEARAQEALSFWSKLWCQGEPTPFFPGSSLPRIVGGQIREVTRRLPTDKALGLDHWSPGEIRLLANDLTDELADIYNRAEREGRWPELLRNALVAMIPKDGALWEAELRPIGLLPYIYRIWMCLRKPHAK